MGVLGTLERALAEAGVARRGGARVIVACSGGGDSVALAAAAVELLGSRRVVLSHVDHAVRAGSSEDAGFVTTLGEELGCEASVERLAPGRDDEARLRALRYEALERARAAAGAELVLTGHTADDQAETLILGLIRSGRLRGIPSRRDRVLRPFLTVSREALRRYLSSRGLSWREDPTNLEPRYLRNRVRKELLPLLESRYRAGFARRLAARAAESQQNFTPRPNSGPRTPVSDFVPPDVSIARRAWQGGALPAGLDAALFDAEAVERVVLRAPRPGDRIRPLGLGGSKKLSDLFVDAKVPREYRGAFPVAARPDGEVLWVPGLARAEAALVGPSTREVWILTCSPRPEGPLSLGGS